MSLLSVACKHLNVPKGTQGEKKTLRQSFSALQNAFGILNVLPAPAQTFSELPFLKAYVLGPSLSEKEAKDGFALTAFLNAQYVRLSSRYKVLNNGILRTSSGINTAFSEKTLQTLVLKIHTLWPQIIKTEGMEIVEEGTPFIVKVDSQPELTEKDQKNAPFKLHIFCLLKGKVLGNGTFGVAKEILSIMEGNIFCFKDTFKQVQKSENDKSAAEKEKKEYLFRQGIIKREYEILCKINGEKEFPLFQEKPVCWISVVRHRLRNRVGFISKKRECSLDKWIISHPIQSAQDSTILIRIQYCKLLMAALAELWRRGFAHGDVKSQNLLCDGATIRLADFASIRQKADEKDQASIAALFKPITIFTFLSKTDGELLDKWTSSQQRDLKQANQLFEYFKSADLFAAGITMFEILTGKMPYQYRTEEDTIAHLPRLQLITKSYPREISDLVIHMLAIDMKARISLEAAIKAWDELSPEHIIQLMPKSEPMAIVKKK